MQGSCDSTARSVQRERHGICGPRRDVAQPQAPCSCSPVSSLGPDLQKLRTACCHNATPAHWKGPGLAHPHDAVEHLTEQAVPAHLGTQLLSSPAQRLGHTADSRAHCKNAVQALQLLQGQVLCAVLRMLGVLGLHQLALDACSRTSVSTHSSCPCTLAASF